MQLKHQVGPDHRQERFKFQVENKHLSPEEKMPKISVSTVRIYLPMLDYTPRIARRKPLLSKKNINKRRLWANDMATKPMDFWKRVIFSDESRFAQFSDARRMYVLRTKDQAYQAKRLQPTVKHNGFSVMVWGAIW